MITIDLINARAIEVDGILDQFIGDAWDYDITNLGDIETEQCEVNGYIITVTDNKNGTYNVKVEH